MKYKIELLENGAWVEVGDDLYPTKESAEKGAADLLHSTEILQAIYTPDEPRVEVRVVPVETLYEISTEVEPELGFQFLETIKRLGYSTAAGARMAIREFVENHVEKGSSDDWEEVSKYEKV